MEPTFLPPESLLATAHIKSYKQYKEMHLESLDQCDLFWRRIAEGFCWDVKPGNEVLSYNFDINQGKIFIEWFKGATTNICFNVLDRHVEQGNGDKVCFYWEGNHPSEASSYTYEQMLCMVKSFAALLRARGVCKGDRVALYMPMTVELPVAMLACARIGAIHSVIFGGFSASSLAERIIDAQCKVLLTCDGVYRGTKIIDLKAVADEAMDMCCARGEAVLCCLVLQHLSKKSDELDTHDAASNEPGRRPCSSFKVSMKPGRDEWWQDAILSVAESASNSQIEWVDAEHPLFMLYTSGSTGKPKGVLHSTAGYMIYAATTFKYIFDHQAVDDVYWCTADCGWITGHSYVVYGPMANGATSVIFEGIPLWPDASRCWQIVEKYRISKFYTAPTAIRSLMKAGDTYVTSCNRDSLRVLGSVGEPINPEAWLWYHNIVGNGRCAVVDTYWQTETGGVMITPLPGAIPLKPGSAAFPFFGVKPILVNPETALPVEGQGEGYLCFERPWPGIMRTVYGDHSRFETTYFRKFANYFTTGDGARRDADGYLWITGRVDDMINVSGHLLSTAEVESALVEHPFIVEAAVVGKTHDVKGECLYCFVTLIDGEEFSEILTQELICKVRTKIGPLATPDYIQEAPGLPKTRSGKIMRRVLRKIANNDKDFGDTSTLVDESVVETLFKLRIKHI